MTDPFIPIFESAHKVPLPKNLQGPSISDVRQFQYATENLREALQKNPELRVNFTTDQLQAIERGDAKIPGYTWHHHQNGVTLELVGEGPHSKTGHSGGRQSTGGRP